MEPVKRVSLTYPDATFDPATNRWTLPEPTARVVGEFGTLRIEIDATWEHALDGSIVQTIAGTDITTINSVATDVLRLDFAEPYGETIGALALPGVTIFDAAPWLRKGVNIDIWRVLPESEAITAGRDEVPYWHGFVASVDVAESADVSQPTQLHLMGALMGEASLRAHQPQMLDDARDIGTMLAQALDPAAYSRPIAPYRFEFETTTTSITTRFRGSRGMSVLDYCDEVLALAQDDDGQWTISRAYDEDDYPQARKYYLRRKAETYATTVQSNTITAGGYGVALSLTSDVTEQPNTIYGEGIAPDGSRWRNAKYPMLSPSAPTYPGPMTLGDVDADFSYDAVTALQYQLRAGGWPDVEITGVFDANTVTALTALQEDAGVIADGDIDNATEWALVWSTGTGTTDLSSGYFRPLYVVPEAEPYEFASNGAVIGANDAYDGRLRVERVIAYGDRISKSRARVHARRIARQANNDEWTGQITLTADQAERSRLLTREGSWVRVRSVAGGYRDVYVAGVSHALDDADTPTTLTVATQPFDLLDLATRLERDRAAKENPARSFYAMRTRSARPFRDALGWDKESGAGDISPRTLSTGWNVIKFVGAQRGTIAAVKARTSSSPQKFALAIFGKPITSTQVAALVANPLAEETTGYGWWNISSIQDDLEGYGFIEAWGEFEEAAGYWPGRESEGHAVTGEMRDALAWTFESADPPFLWAAVYVPAGCTFRASMRIVIEE